MPGQKRNHLYQNYSQMEFSFETTSESKRDRLFLETTISFQEDWRQITCNRKWTSQNYKPYASKFLHWSNTAWFYKPKLSSLLVVRLFLTCFAARYERPSTFIFLRPYTKQNMSTKSVAQKRYSCPVDYINIKKKVGNTTVSLKLVYCFKYVGLSLETG